MTRAARAKNTTKTPRKSPRSAPVAPDALAVMKRLKREFPDAKCALDHETPHQLLVATILSAQCTDARVNLVTRDLFRKYPDVAAFAQAESAEMEKDVKSTGFFRMKARAVVEMSRDVLLRHGGEVPRTMAEMVEIPGVARKTANVVLGNAYGIVEGIAVDTHVRRLSQRMDLSRRDDPADIEQDLMALLPRERWFRATYLLIDHGRRVCQAKRPACDRCPVGDLCPRRGL